MLKKNKLFLITLNIFLIIISLILASFIVHLQHTSKKIAQKTYTVGFSIHFLHDEYTVTLVNSFKNAIKGNAQAIVVNAEGDPRKQVSDIENFIKQKVDAIVICSLDDPSVKNSLETAQKNGIKVVTITKIKNFNADAVIYGNEYTNGYEIGKYLLKQFEHTKPVKAISIDLSSQLLRIDQRLQGFSDALKGSNIQLVNVGKADTNEEAMDYVKTMLEKDTDIHIIFGSYSNAVIGAGAACKALNRKDIYVCGIDADKMILNLINEGWVFATAKQFPEEQGKECSDAVLKLLDGKSVKEQYTSPVKIISNTDTVKKSN